MAFNIIKFINLSHCGELIYSIFVTSGFRKANRVGEKLNVLTMKKLENLKGKKLGNMKSVIAGKKSLELTLAGPCGGTGTASDPHVLETVTIFSSGGGQNDGCD